MRRPQALLMALYLYWVTWENPGRRAASLVGGLRPLWHPLSSARAVLGMRSLPERANELARGVRETPCASLPSHEYGGLCSRWTFIDGPSVLEFECIGILCPSDLPHSAVDQLRRGAT